MRELKENFVDGWDIALQLVLNQVQLRRRLPPVCFGNRLKSILDLSSLLPLRHLPNKEVDATNENDG